MGIPALPTGETSETILLRKIILRELVYRVHGPLDAAYFEAKSPHLKFLYYHTHVDRVAKHAHTRKCTGALF